MGTFSKTFGACLVQQGANSSYAPVITSPTSGTITDVGATVAGTIDNGKLSTVWSVEYGLTNAYGSTATGGTIETPTSISKSLTGLDPFSTYHWRIKAINSKGTTYSADQTFKTIEPSIILDGNTVGWYDSSMTSLITKDVNNLVSIWWDRVVGNSTLGAEETSGTTVAYGVYLITATQTNHFFNGCQVGDTFVADGGVSIDANNKVRRYSGNHICALADANKPLYTTTGILFDGLSSGGDSLLSAVFTYNQPSHIYLVFKQISWTDTDTILDGRSGANSGRIRQSGTTPSISVSAGTASSNNANLPLNQYGILRVVFNGASSKFQIDDSAPITGNFGSNNMGGISMASRGDSFAAANANIQVIEAIFRKVSDNETNENIIYNYLKKKLI